MSRHDIAFALRSVSYLKAQGLRSSEIERVLRDELDCPGPIATRLAATA